jgi:peptide/nickel transport system permease protein
MAVAVVILTPAFTFVVFEALEPGSTPGGLAGGLVDYMSATFLHFDFGVTGPPTRPEPIKSIVVTGMPVDVALIVGGLAFGAAGGLALGMLSGGRRRSRVDRALGLGSAAALSVPVYWLGLALLFGFAPRLGLFPVAFVSPVAGYVAPTRDPIGWLHAMWVPWLVLALPLAAQCHRMTRASLRDVEGEDWARTARAKGLGDGAVRRRHLLPAALPPVVTLIAVNMAALVTNAVLVEAVFHLPGAFRLANGQFLSDTAPGPRVPVVRALVVEIAVIIAIATVLCDILLAAVDPRVRR